MQWRDGTNRFKFQPLTRTARRQPVQRRGEFRRGLGRIFPESRQGFESDHSVMECLAIGAGNGLDGKMLALVRAAGDASAITAPGTFEQISTAHKQALDVVG